MSLKKIMLYPILVSVGWAINLLPLSFSLGHTFFLGGIFTFLIMWKYPFPLILLGSVLINITNIGLWHHPYLLAFSLLEISFLWYMKKRGIRNLVGMDGVFWLFPGIPAAFILFYGISGYTLSHLTLILANYAVNGILCVTLANLLIFSWYLVKNRLFKKSEERSIPMRTLLFNVVTFGFLILALLFSFMANQQYFDRIFHTIYAVQDREMENLVQLVESEEVLSEVFYRKIDQSGHSIALLKGDQLISSSVEKDTAFRWDSSILAEIVQKDQSRFLYDYGEYSKEESLPWQNTSLILIQKVTINQVDVVVIATSLDYLADGIQDFYLRNILMLLLILYLAFLIALVSSGILADPISKLTALVEILSREEIDSLGYVQWPRSSIKEIQNLVEYSQKTYGNIIERNVQLSSLNRSLEYSANYDGLTKLPNRSLLMNVLKEKIAEDNPLALVFLDLDGFKMVNDTKGHQVGDSLLIEFAYRLTTSREKDFAARLGGDEFAMILCGYESSEELSERLNGIMEKIRKPIDVNGELHMIHSSLGIALFPEHGRQVPPLLKNADLAMYKVKTSGKNNWLIYRPELDNALTQYEMERGIYTAFEQDQFELYYQPQVDIRNGHIVSLEALIRWNHPQQGFISPSLFIPLAERMDIIIDIGYWVIEEAAKKGKALCEKGFEGVVSVNVSPRQFSEVNFYEMTKGILERIGLEPRFFGIEVTETMVMGNVSFTSKIISRFMNYGVRVSIDDFGTGYTSLSLLQDLNVHTLKIDQAFVEKVGHSRKNEIVLNNIINLTKELEMEIVIEGVETEEQNAFFRDRACYTSQGFLYHRPMPFSDLDRVIKESEA